MAGVAVVVAVALALVGAARAAPESDRIVSMPRYNGTVPFTQYSGYLNAGGEKRLHYWLTEASQGNPEDLPLMLWLNGGPGCSSLYGLLSELGPFKFNRADFSDLNLYPNPHAWNTISNVLFVESPVGVGFSYSDSPADYSNNDTGTALDNYRMLQNFFELFPEYNQREFYIAGESYAGMYIPMLADEIRRGNDRGEPFINLQGFMVGNGVTDPESDSTINSLAPFSFGHGLISQKTYAKIGECNGGATPSDPACLSGLNELNVALRGVHRYSIYEPCYNARTVDWSLQTWDDHINGDIPCVNNDQDVTYLNLPEVKAALHVKADINWVICSDTLRYTKNLGSNSYTFYPELVSRYRIVIFAGETDAAVPYVGSETWVAKLAQPLVEDWRAWIVNDQVAGYVTTYESISFVTFKEGWHTVPESHPVESLHMLDRFYKDLPLGD